MSTEVVSSHDSDVFREFEQWSSVSRVMTDQYCHACGFNLHTQFIRRDPRTQVLMSRCPECGRFHSVGEVTARLATWSRRSAMVAIVLWVLFLFLLALAFGITQGVISYGLLQEFTHYDIDHPLSGIGPYYYRYERILSPGWKDINQRHIVYGILGGVSFGLGLISSLIAWVVVPHWRRFHHALFILVWAILAGAFATWVWWYDTVQLFWWGVGQVAILAMVYILGGLLATIFGRPLIRFIGRVCLPSRVRTMVERTSTWLLDDKKAT